MDLKNIEKKQIHNYIFKICRVHNIQDLKTVISNGANMIGIHAVYFDRNNYMLSENKYQPLYNKNIEKEELPLATLEIDSIREMQKYITDEIEQVILFQRSLTVEKMKECFEIYNIPISKAYIQLHYRTNKEEIENIKNKLCNRVIAVVGIFQKDLVEYFTYLQKILDYRSDYILIDLSEHQSDLSIYDNSMNKLSKIRETAPMIEENKVPIILAEDTNIETMEKYLNEIAKHNILIKGIDMQNAVEINKNEQKYEIIDDKNNKYQIKKRKSEKLMNNWKKFLKTDITKIFNKGGQL